MKNEVTGKDGSLSKYETAYMFGTEKTLNTEPATMGDLLKTIKTDMKINP